MLSKKIKIAIPFQQQQSGNPIYCTLHVMKIANVEVSIKIHNINTSVDMEHVSFLLFPYKTLQTETKHVLRASGFQFG